MLVVDPTAGPRPVGPMETDPDTPTSGSHGAGRPDRVRGARGFGGRLRREGFVVGVLAAGVYLTAAILLDFVYLSMPGDAVSRMANGFYALYSRDPHLAAIGFVWTPLTSMADLVILLFKGVWPSLATHDLAGSLVTVVAMTGAVHQLRATLREWGVPRVTRLVLTGLFALNPMTLYFAGNGMSEALYLFALVAASRYLCQWLRDQNLKALVYAATALSLGYLARNETVGAALLTGVLVAAVSIARGRGPRRERIMGAFTDVAIVIAPVATAVVGWAAASYVVTKHLFEQFQGNATLVQAAGFNPGSVSTRLLHEGQAIEHLAPVLPGVVVLALAVAWHRRDPQAMGLFAVLGGGLAFSLASYFDGLLFPWIRYYITVIPLSVLLVGYLVSSPPAPATSASVAARGRTRRAPGVVVAAAGVAVALVTLGPSLPAGAVAMLNPRLGPDTSQGLGFIFHSRLSPQDLAAKDAFAAVQSIDRAVTAMHLPHGSVVVDNQVQCVPEVLTSIADSRVFVIPNDRDFQEILADPLTFHSRFLLASSGSRDPDTVRAAYPGIGKSGGVTEYVWDIASRGGCPTLTLYRVVGHPLSPA